MVSGSVRFARTDREARAKQEHRIGVPRVGPARSPRGGRPCPWARDRDQEHDQDEDRGTRDDQDDLKDRHAGFLMLASLPGLDERIQALLTEAARDAPGSPNDVEALRQRVPC